MKKLVVGITAALCLQAPLAGCSVLPLFFPPQAPEAAEPVREEAADVIEGLTVAYGGHTAQVAAADTTDPTKLHRLAEKLQRLSVPANSGGRFAFSFSSLPMELIQRLKDTPELTMYRKGVAESFLCRMEGGTQGGFPCPEGEYILCIPGGEGDPGCLFFGVVVTEGKSLEERLLEACPDFHPGDYSARAGRVLPDYLYELNKDTLDAECYVDEDGDLVYEEFPYEGRKQLYRVPLNERQRAELLRLGVAEESISGWTQGDYDDFMRAQPVVHAGDFRLRTGYTREELKGIPLAAVEFYYHRNEPPRQSSVFTEEERDRILELGIRRKTWETLEAIGLNRERILNGFTKEDIAQLQKE